MTIKEFIDNLPVKNSVLAGGTAATIAQTLLYVLASFGIVIPPPLDTFVVAGVGFLITHLVPNSVQDCARDLLVKAQDLATFIPTIYPEYPKGKNGA